MEEEEEEEEEEEWTTAHLEGQRREEGGLAHRRWVSKQGEEKGQVEKSEEGRGRRRRSRLPSPMTTQVRVREDGHDVASTSES